MSPFRHILVPIDFGEPSDEALDCALTMAVRFEARVTLLHVTWLPPYYASAYAEGIAYPTDDVNERARGALDQAVARARLRYPQVDGVLVAGEAWEQILDVVRAGGADLIVMGTHGRRGLSRVFLGSVAEKVIRHSPVPVLTTGARPAP